MTNGAAAPPGPRHVWLARLLMPVVVFGHVALTGFWMWRNGFLTRPLSSDGAWRRLEALPMLEGLQHDGLMGWLRAGLAHDRPHPPLMMMAAALFSGPEGELTPLTCWLAIAFFSLLLGFGTYALARRFGSPWFALAVTAMMGSAPAAALNMRAFYPQGPMTGIAVWCLWSLLKTERFQRTGWSAFFGLCMGVATLTKMLAPMYVAGGVLVAFVPAVLAPLTRRRATANLVLATVIALALCAPWYAPHLGRVVDYTQSVVGDGGQVWFSASLPIWSVERWTYYPLALLNEGLMIPLGLISAVALVVLLLRRRSRRGADIPDAIATAGAGQRWRDGWILGAAIVASYPVLTFGQVAGQSYYLSLVPSVSSIAVCAALRGISRRRWRHLAITITVLATAFDQFALQRPFWAEQRVATVPEWGPFLLFPRLNCVLCPAQALEVGAGAQPAAEPWPIKRLVSLMLAASTRPSPRVAVWMADARYFHPFIDFPVLEYDAERVGRHLEWVQIEKAFRPGHVPTPAELHTLLSGIDFIVVDHRAVLTPEYCRLIAKTAGVEAEQLLLEQVTPQSLVGLYRIHVR